MVGVPYSGGALNPVRSLGPAVVTHNFPGYRTFCGAMLVQQTVNADQLADG